MAASAPSSNLSAAAGACFSPVGMMGFAAFSKPVVAVSTEVVPLVVFALALNRLPHALDLGNGS